MYNTWAALVPYPSQPLNWWLTTCCLQGDALQADDSMTFTSVANMGL
jgi:hypothetical protein